MKSFAITTVLLISFLFTCCTKREEVKNIRELPKELTRSVKYKTENEEVVEGLPEIGRWMFDSSGTPASWLGKKLNGKNIREPINIIIADSISRSVEEAKINLINALNEAGYKNRWGHTSGYKGLMDTTYCTQLQEENFHAFSDEPFELNNNHGRIFGPCFKNGTYYFTGALSREKGYVHDYISFTQARDDLAASLDARTNYKLINKIKLDNSINSDSLTTGDHDGYAIFIEAVRFPPSRE